MTLNPDAIDIFHSDIVHSYAQVAKAGIKRVIHKATEGETEIDPSYKLRRPLAIGAGLAWEAYHFWRPVDPESQAKNFVKAVGDASMHWLDYEVSGGNPASIIALMKFVNAVTGQTMGLYTTKSLAESLAAKATVAQAAFLARCDLWLAEPGVEKPVLGPHAAAVWPKISLWQYSWSGKISGVSGKVDLNCVPEAA